MKTVRTDLTKEDVLINMVELAGYLAQQEEEVNTINMTCNGLHMEFTAYIVEKSKK